MGLFSWLGKLFSPSEPVPPAPVVEDQFSRMAQEGRPYVRRYPVQRDLGYSKRTSATVYNSTPAQRPNDTFNDFLNPLNPLSPISVFNHDSTPTHHHHDTPSHSHDYSPSDCGSSSSSDFSSGGCDTGGGGGGFGD